MRKLILPVLLAAMVLPAAAARRVTVTQLEQALAADSAAHRADSDAARNIGQLELTERLTDATLGRIAAKLTLGPRTALALQLLADQSAFLDPPAGEMPATGFPDAATQQRLMDAARGYVIQTLPHLPNFFVTRTTSRFDDGPQVLEQGGWPVRAGLHLLGTKTQDVTFFNGKEIQDPVTEKAAARTPAGAPQAQQELGLYSFGEFGPVLAKVLADTAKGKVTWSHWEQTSAGLAAVFHYSVPRSASQYNVHYCCLRDEEFIERREMTYRSRSQSAQQMANLPKTTASKPFNDTPGYHGSLFIDPATGAILRITLEAELKEGDPITRADIVVEYGPVTIGDQRYICPVRSLAFSTEQAVFSGHPGNLPVLLLNETSFTHYHRLGATARILADASEPAAPGTEPPVPGSQNVTSSSPSAPQTSTPAGANAPPPATTTEITAAPALPPPPIAPPPPAQPVIPEITLTEARGVPDEPLNPPQPQEGGYSLKLTSRLVDVGIVVYDKKGHPVKDLKPEDFEVYNNGRKQDLRFFSQFAGQAAAPLPADLTPDRTFSNRSADAGAAATAAPETGATVLLIDESHIAWADMSHARQEILKFLSTVAPGERVGLYTMTALGFRVLQEITTDHAALTARLQKWMPTAQSAALAQEEETRNRQSFNEVHSVADLNSVNGNQVDVPDTQATVDPQLRTMGSNPARASLIVLGSVARHLSAVSGHKNLVWVSTDNVFADWQTNQVAIDKSPKAVDSFALHAQEAMNDAHVAVFPMDVSQLETAAIGADIQHRNVELTQAAMDTATVAPQAGGVGRNMAPGRIAAQMQQDMHPIQGPIRQVAEATGGRVIRRAGDLAAELAGVVEDGHATYLVSFSPQGQADGQYHTITVKLTGKHNGLTLRYRTGYLFAKEPATLKDRFQQAVWRPRDVSEISVTAGTTPMNPGANVKIDILAGDLGLQQQAGRWMDKLDIFFIQRDDAGLHAQVEGQTLGLRLRSSTYQNLMAAGVPFERFVQMRPGMASLRILVVDENSGRMGSVTLPAAALEAAH